MRRFKLILLTATLFLGLISFSAKSQFSFKPKRSNLVIKFSEESGWELTNTIGNKTYASFTQENAYIQIINNELRVYTMSTALWNTHPSSKLLNLVKLKYTTIDVDTGSTWFDPFSSFWISSAGGHLRIFKYNESVTVKDKNGKKITFKNKNIENHLFLNQKKNSEISSFSTIFMVSPSGDIFEIEPETKIWRFILKNRTLTAWSSEPPEEKMLFHIFSPTSFKKVIPLGSKNDKYLFQTINHENKMGLASLSKDFFQVIIEVPPIFDFISPSLNADYNLIYDNGKLGVLYFLPSDDTDDEIPQFKSFKFQKATEIAAHKKGSNSNILLANNKTFKITKNEITKESTDFKTNINFGLTKLKNGLLLYTEYDDTQKIKHSGVFSIALNKWFVSPNKSLIKTYNSNMLLVDNIETKQAISYSVCTNNGFFNAKDITDLNSREFFLIASEVTETEIDSLVPLPNYDEFTYKFLDAENEKWGVLTIKEENFEVILPAKYDWIQHFGYKQSLLLADQNQFGWYGIDYSKAEKKPQLITPTSSHIILYAGNSLEPSTHYGSSPRAYYSAHFFHNLIIYNNQTDTDNITTGKAWVLEDFNQNPVFESNHIEVFEKHLNVNLNNKMSLYSHKLKPLEISTYDSVSVHKEIMLFYEISSKQTPNTPPKLVAAFYNQKRIKALNKYDQKFFYGDYFVVKKDNQWIVLSPEGKTVSENPLLSLKQAINTGDSLQK